MGRRGRGEGEKPPESIHSKQFEWMNRLNESYPTRLWWCLGTTLLASFQFGYQVGVLNTCVSYVAKSLDYDNETMLNSVVMVGAALGALTAGVFADALGPKRAQTLNTINFLVGTALSSSNCLGHWGFVSGRVIAGIGAGAASLYTPRYIAEIAPRELRGSLVTQHQVFVNVGILVSYFMGLPYEYDLININIMGQDVPWWRVMIMMALLPAFFQLFGLLGCLESPVWLERHNKELADECWIQLWGSRAILFEAGPDNYAHGSGSTVVLSGFPTLSQPLLARSSQGDRHSESGSTAAHAGERMTEGWLGMFQQRYQWMLTLALGLPVLQQLCGVSTVILFSSEVFQDAGLTSPIWGSIFMGTANLAFTVVAGALMDRVGRRPMLIASYSGMAACLLLVSLLDSMFVADPAVPITPTTEMVGFATSALLIMYVLFFALGAGPVTWLYLSEILPPAIKGKAAALATFLCWTSNLAVALTFRSMLQNLGVGGSYLIYAGFNVFSFCWLYFHMVETKCHSLREIEALLLLPDQPFLLGTSQGGQGTAQLDPSICFGQRQGDHSQRNHRAAGSEGSSKERETDTALFIPSGVPVYRDAFDAMPASSLPD